MLQYYFLLEFCKNQIEVGNNLPAQDQVATEPTPPVHLKEVKQWSKEDVEKYSVRVIRILSSHDNLPPADEVISWYIVGLYGEIREFTVSITCDGLPQPWPCFHHKWAQTRYFQSLPNNQEQPSEKNGFWRAATLLDSKSSLSTPARAPHYLVDCEQIFKAYWNSLGWRVSGSLGNIWFWISFGDTNTGIKMQ